MTFTEVLNIAGTIATLGVGLLAIPSFVLMWFQSTEETQEKYRRFWRLFKKKAYRGWVYLSGCVLIGRGMWEIVQFAISPLPMTRLDVLLLLGNSLSLGVFTLTTLGTVVLFAYEDRKERDATQNP